MSRPRLHYKSVVLGVLFPLVVACVEDPVEPAGCGGRAGLACHAGEFCDYTLEETGFHVARDREMAQIVARAVLELPPSEREVVVLRHYHDLSFPNIAEILGSPVTTVKSRMARGLTLLRTRLAALET